MLPDRARMSVVIPAHNEAGVITRLLHTITASSKADELEVVVVPNGCTDDTAERAAAFMGVTVKTIATGSKIAALGEGDHTATVFPRAYVDADVEVSTEALLALADALSTPGGPLVASPRLVVDTTGASWPVKQFYKIWELTEYRQAGHIGSGIYALAEQGRARFGDWPQIIADDRFVQQLFLPKERLSLPNHSFTVRSPRTLRAQIRRATRIVRGNRELPSNLQTAAQPSPGRHLALVRRVLRRPDLWVALPFYVVGSLAANLRARQELARGAPPLWHRDDTTRPTDE